MAEGNAALLKELTEAREKIQRQLDLMQTTAPIYGARNRQLQIGSVRDELIKELGEINECISDLETPDA